MKYELKDSVKKYVESKQLNENQLDGLMGLVDAQSKPAKDQSRWLQAIVVVAVIGVAIGLYWNTTARNHSEVSLLIAEEVVHNHLKMKPLEVSSHSLHDMRAYFNQLDFSLRSSSVIENTTLQLLGGRYCSIQGITAAQIRLKDKQTGDLETLYQAPYNKELFKDLPKLQEGHAPVRHFINGIAVEVWVEKGILFARTFSDT